MSIVKPKLYVHNSHDTDATVEIYSITAILTSIPT